MKPFFQQNPEGVSCRTILVVDDDPNNLGVVTGYLSEGDFTILVAEDGECALERARYALPDLILLDVMMPGIDGYETCRRLQEMEETKGIPVIFMTALAETEHKINGFKAGGVDYIAKPFQREEVLARVDVHLRLRELTQRLRHANESLGMRDILRSSQLAETNKELQEEIAERQRAEEEIRMLNAQLEQRVIERTAQLSEANKALAREVEQRKAAQEEITLLNEDLLRQREALEVANQELDSFSYSVSHDLRAPLRHIAGFCGILAEDHGSELSERAAEYLGRIQSGVNRMEKLINALLEFSRLNDAQVQSETIDLSVMATDVLAEYANSSPERKVSTVVQQGLTAEGDQNLLLVLMDNLLGNAWKYTGKTVEPKIEFGAREMDGKTVFFVRDNGAGFDMNHADKLFGVFQRLHSDKDFKGEGIGLATVQRIISRHGGRIWAEAALNKGATFYFSLDGSPSARSSG